MSVEEDTELRDLVAQTLETNGVLNKIRAELRANVFLALEEQDTLQKKSISNKPLKNFLETKDGQQAFSIVREFVQFFNLDFTLAVLDPESDFAGKSSSRENLINDMNLTNMSSNIPVLVDILKQKGEGRVSPPSPKIGSKIPQRIADPKPSKNVDINKNKVTTPEKKSTLLTSNDDDDDFDNEDELLKELGVSPLSHNTNNKKNTKPSWLSSEPSNKLFDNHMKDEKSTLPPPVTGLGSLKDAPPLGGLGKNASLTQSPLDVTSPEWDDLMKIDQKISELGFEIPKEDTSYKEKKSLLKDSDFNYDDDFNPSSSQKSDGLSITEEIEDDISIGSFAGSKGDDVLTTDQTVSQISGVGFDYGEDAELY